MKKLSLSLILALTTLNGLSQTVTNDTLVCLPKSTMLKVTEDLLRGDQCAKELRETNIKVADLTSTISFKDSLLNQCAIRDSLNASSMLVADSIKNKNTLIIQNLNTKITIKNNKLWGLGILAAILTVVVFVK